MAQPFSYLHSVRHRGIEAMRRLLLLSLLMSGVVYGQNQPLPEKIKPDVILLQNLVNDAVGLSLPGWGVLQGAKGAYLDGYGVVVTIEVALDSPQPPFA